MYGISSSSQYNLYSQMLAGNSMSSQLNSLLSGNSGSQNAKEANPFYYDYAAENNKKFEKIMADRKATVDKATEIVSNYNKTTTAFYNGFDSKMSALMDSAYSLKNTHLDSAVSQMGYGSDNGKVITVDSKFAAGSNQYAVKVNQLASGQRTTYAPLDTAGTGTFTGKNNLTLQSGDQTYSFDFDFADGTTNKQALSAIANKINQSDSKIKAGVSDINGKSVLQLYAAETGTTKAFTATATGSMSDALTVANQEAAQDAKYSVNGVDYTSDKNQIELSQGLTATLTGTGEAKVNQSQMDNDKLVDAVKKFASNYNDVVDFLKSNSALSKAVSNMANSFSDIRYSSGMLSQVGIEVSGSGKLSVNESKLTESIANNMDLVKDVIGSSKGIGSKVYDKAFRAMNSTQNLVAPPKYSNGFYGYTAGTLFDIIA